MDRRRFLTLLGAAPIAAKIGVLESVCPAIVEFPCLDIIPCHYVDYVNFSEFALSAAIDEAVSNAAMELSMKLGQRIGALQNSYETA